MTIQFKSPEFTPRGANSRGRFTDVREELRAHPGVWAEVERVSKTEYSKITGRRVNLINGHDDLKATVVTEGAEAVLYAMAVTR